MAEHWRREPGVHRDTTTMELYESDDSTAGPAPTGAGDPADGSADVNDLPGVDDPGDDPDDLTEQLATAAPRRWWNRTTLYLAGALLLVAGFLSGLQVQKSYGSSPGGNRGEGSFPAGAAGAFGRQGAPGQQGGGPGAAGAGGGSTTGTVKLIDHGTVYVQTASGDVITVKTTGNTKVGVTRAGKLTDLKAGDSVTVQGSAGSDGTVTATAVTAGPK
ncbi:hypothetical protein [Rhizomonospora bruguierae]|uniref:hypothetical protein n=1 Tax=Rhizomonospora bruguierae TaxID=1581705 RepID=UPI0020C03D6B|nr:hypothetical protein [Micromonospora sp. NBRC 107566]